VALEPFSGDVAHKRDEVEHAGRGGTNSLPMRVHESCAVQRLDQRIRVELGHLAADVRDAPDRRLVLWVGQRVEHRPFRILPVAVAKAEVRAGFSSGIGVRPGVKAAALDYRPRRGRADTHSQTETLPAANSV
jgi:hypothetical protein